ncbi:MAG: phospho-N-acetylmuramoyl-pentapeptide-transferase [Clostridia bacterium]|nr:phospho-N-acetylmuramoyl-pentapeptide-transferase [Clostridia bacterium]
MEGIWIFIAAVISFIIASLSGIKLIPLLHKLKYGQTILEIGPSWHKDKQGTPTMGGIMFIISSIVSALICIPLYYIFSTGPSEITVAPILVNTKIIAGVVMALCYGVIGFFDDYIKVVKRRNMGLSAKQKLILQFLVAAAYLATLYISGSTSKTIIPFIGYVDLGIFYWIIAAIVIVGFVNATNLTDGIDGLNGSVTFFAAAFLMMIASYIGIEGISILSATLAGGCLGYLVWNFHPAKVFMGDTGSLFIGGFLCALAFGLDIPIILIPIGIVYIIEMFSVILQVSYFKITKGKRLFKMSPIHHHFEMCGWNEIKICIVASMVTVVMGVGSLFMVLFGV